MFNFKILDYSIILITLKLRKLLTKDTSEYQIINSFFISFLAGWYKKKYLLELRPPLNPDICHMFITVVFII